MKLSIRFIVVLLAVLLVMGQTDTQPVEAQDGRQVWVYYFGWHTGDSWNDGRLIDHPAAGNYSSQDGGTIDRQISEAQSAGIDAFIMSWFGPKNGNLTNNVLNMLLDTSASKGFHAAASVDMSQGDFNATTGEVLESLTYLVNDRVNHPGYLRYNGKPVIYFWNQGRFSAGEWRDIRNQVDPNHNTLWIAEGTSTALLPIFDGLYLFNTAWAGNPGSIASQYRNRVLSAGGVLYTPTVLPGWDESRIGGRDNATSPRDRDNGDFLRRSWNGAVGSGADVILIVSWNEYLENSHIEPSQTYSSQSLDALRQLVVAWESGSSAPAPVSGAAPASQPPPGAAVAESVYATVNVRSAPNREAEELGTITMGQRWTVTGEQDGWYAIDFNGQTGYVLGTLVRVEQTTQ